MTATKTLAGSKTLLAANDDVVVECELEAAPEKVWRALTIPEFVATWLLPNDMSEPRAGEKFNLDGGKFGLSTRIDCEVLDAEPQRRLRYSWREADDTASVVTFELAPHGEGTKLRVTHGAAMPAVTMLAANCNAPPLRLAA
jgi:uncharacterized protein YndB with AHSA1/START domain